MKNSNKFSLQNEVTSIHYIKYVLLKIYIPMHFAHVFLLLLFSFTFLLLGKAQPPTASQRSVVVEAQSLMNGTAIQFDWLADSTATGYTVYKKRYGVNEWGDPIVSLPGDATSWTDDQTATGTQNAMEYAFFKHEFKPVEWTVCVPGNSSLRFEINDMYGIGLCCSFGYGYYTIEACDSLFAMGDDFAYGAIHGFNLCENTDTCVDVKITIFPDIFPNSTSWQLFNNSTGETLATSGPVGTYISPRPAYGYIYAGNELYLDPHHGKILLLVDDAVVDSLETELAQLRYDLWMDGWHPLQLNVSRQASVVDIKDQIKAIAQTHDSPLSKLTSLYIIGHVPVPYSGDIYPDTHTEHRGAWAADSYYADLDGDWTDSIADRSTAFFEYNHNVPGDGKFDQGLLPSSVELAVGRVDFFNMPAFEDTEIQLLRKYLRKASDYKHGRIKTIQRALIDDNFQTAFAAPAASGWRNFGPLVGIDSIFERDYFLSASEAPYQWVYGCGSGTHISSAGIGNTMDFANDSLQSIFSMLFGSQFGDWDNVNNFLRAPLASGTTLTNCWAGNPPWTFHPMALGEHIGNCVKLTQNSNTFGYLPGPQMVHIALMGDPSLRMHPMAGVEDLSLEQIINSVQLEWPKSSDTTVIQYAVYRQDSTTKIYNLLSFNVLDTFYVDTQPNDGKNIYLVKPVRLQKSPSGTYFNTGMGTVDSLQVNLVISSLSANGSTSFQLFPNPTADRVHLRFPENMANKEVRVFNTRGQVVHQKYLKIFDDHYIFSLRGKSVGVYWVEVSFGKQKLIRKLMKIK